MKIDLTSGMTLHPITFTNTKVEVFLDKDVREAAPDRERGNTHRGAANKREISRTSLSINLRF